MVAAAGIAIGFLFRSAIVIGSSSPEWWVAVGTLTLATATAASILVTEARERGRDRPVLSIAVLDYAGGSAVQVGEGPILAVKNIGPTAARDVGLSLLEYSISDDAQTEREQRGWLSTASLGRVCAYLEPSPAPDSLWIIHSETYTPDLPQPQLVSNMWNEDSEFSIELSWRDRLGRAQPVLRRVLRRVKKKDRTIEVVMGDSRSLGVETWVWYDSTLPGERIEPISVSLRRLRNGTWKRPNDAERLRRSDLR